MNRYQNILDANLNAFGLELFLESLARQPTIRQLEIVLPVRGKPEKQFRVVVREEPTGVDKPILPERCVGSGARVPAPVPAGVRVVCRVCGGDIDVVHHEDPRDGRTLRLIDHDAAVDAR